METVFCMVIILLRFNSKCLKSLFLLAILDGIENNDAFKHNKQEHLNETWVQLMQDLRFWEETDGHVSYLRSKWVIGSSEWMSGLNNSKQNDKILLGYSDNEWEYIWATMLEDGAWNVPHIKDSAGNITKHNYAPEMLIKYIGHDLRCHIIVFDLILNKFSSAQQIISSLKMLLLNHHYYSITLEDTTKLFFNKIMNSL